MPHTTPQQLIERNRGRYDAIVAIVGRGNVVRFHYDDVRWKDVKDATMDDMGDMKSFRSNGTLSPYVMWENRALRIEELFAE